MEQRKENKMGVMPVNRLLITMSLPIMISMLVQALYNIVDSMFVAQINEAALTAVSLAFPVQNLMIAVAVGTGVGINSLLSRRLGEKRYEDANGAALNGIFVSVLSWLVFAVFGLFFSKIFIQAFTDDAEIISMGTKYISICTIFSIGVFLQIACERILQATGVTIYNMIMQLVGAIVNIILDPILIFGWFGLPKMGITGAAVATVIGQIIAMGLGFYFNHKKNHEVNMSFKNFKPSIYIIKEIYKVGFPSIIMQSIGSVMLVGMNKILALFSTTAVTVFGVYFKLQSFIFMPIFGLTNGLVPIIGFNYGAKKKDRMIYATKLSMVYSVVIMLIGTLIFQFFPDKLLMLFNASEDLLSIGVHALRIISICFVFAGISIVLSCVFQAIGNGVLSMITSVVRQLIVILPVAYLMANFIGLNYVWFAFPISEIISTLMSIFMYRYVYDKEIKIIDDDKNQN